MKKVVLSMAGLLAAIAFAPEASAVPAFARQMGVACNTCHYQHFPLLNSFGRAFKSSGFTMMGTEGKIEGDDLSIPNQLNITAFATTGYQNISNATAGTSSGKYLMPNGGGELSLFFGGRISDSAGFLSELSFPDANSGGSSAKLPLLWDVGNGVRVGIVPMANKAPAWSFELLNTGAVSTHLMMINNGFANSVSGGAGAHANSLSAAQYLGTNAAGNGASFVATGNMGFVNIGKYSINNLLSGIAVPGANNPTDSNALNTTYARGAFLFDVGGWDSAVGVQSFSGSDGTAGGTGADTKATIIDGQMQGAAGGMPLGIYASYGVAPVNAGNILGNAYNSGGITDKKSFNIAGELGVLPRTTLQLAYRSGKNGGAAGAEGDNAYTLGATYLMAQNMNLSLAYTANSGSAYDAAALVGPVMGKTVTTLLLAVAF